MKIHRLHREQTVPAIIAQVFEFFSKPENLARITPDELGFRVLTPSPVPMHTGTTIDYTINVLGMTRHWTTLITDFRPPHRFVDVQLKGPYAFWHHTHTFEQVDSVTLLTDDVRYAMPLGPLGAIAHGLLVRRQLQRIFDHRRTLINGLFGGLQ